MTRKVAMMTTDDRDTVLATPEELAGLVAVQAGAVVSRTILKGRGGTVTLFAFGAGEGLSEHTTPHEALVVCLDGEADITVGGETHRLETGRALRLPAGVPHAVAAVAPFRMMLVMLRDPAG
ncbi:MAG: cupin domain-containing protein [Gemmatimonadota bacterium]|nr:cupin domain-containing protein [Gemmatimonadota bacterium]